MHLNQISSPKILTIPLLFIAKPRQGGTHGENNKHGARTGQWPFVNLSCCEGTTISVFCLKIAVCFEGLKQGLIGILLQWMHQCGS